jgi:hypothetical protein
MFSLISLPVPSQQMTMFFIGVAPRIAGGSLAVGGRYGYWH